MRRNNGKKLCIFLCAAVLVAAAVALSGALKRETAPCVPLFPDKAGSFSVLAAGSAEQDTAAVFSGTDSSILLRCNAEGVQARADLSVPLDWAAVWDNARVLKSDAAVFTYDPSTLQEVSQTDLPWPADDVLAFSMDQNGAMYAVLSQSRNCLQIHLQDGTEAVETLPGEIDGVCPCPQGVWVWANGELRAVSGLETRSFPWPCAPLAAFGQTAFLDRDGLFCTCGEDEIFPLFRCEHALYEGPYSCVDPEGCLLTADGAAVLRFRQDGQLIERCELEAAPDAVSTNGAIFHKDGEFCFSPFSFVPQASETPAPTPSETPPLRLENDYIVLPCGATVQELRDLIKPEAAEIRDRAGRLLTTGTLATGMTANDWVIVVEGDVNGSGTITGSDLHEAILLCIGQQQQLTPQLRAADLNDDGVLDTHDLLMLSKLIEQMKP